MTLTPPITIVIRTKNEARWIDSCLFAVSQQDYPEFEIVLVDNDSTDGTLDIARKYDIKVLRIPDSEFNYSRALNLGIRAGRGELVAILSGHCIPVNELWLAHLVMNFQDSLTVACYGRQEPLPDTSPADKRDLWITFGLDRKVQKKDYFFHNANSMIRKSVWEEVPFNEKIHGVEDQDWAKKILNNGSRIVYEPLAAVFHHHGIHHGGNEERVARVVSIIELIQQDLT